MDCPAGVFTFKAARILLLFFSPLNKNPCWHEIRIVFTKVAQAAQLRTGFER